MMKRNWQLEKYRPSNQANLLLGKTVGQLHAESVLKADVDTLENELKRIAHVKECERCKIEAVLGIERYLGGRLPWYLNLVNDVGGQDGCPDVKDYEIGYYGNDCQPGTFKFIEARLAWAEKIMKEELKDRKEHLSEMSNFRRW